MNNHINRASTAPRLIRIAGSLEKKEHDPDRIARIQALLRKLETMAAAPAVRQGEEP